MTYAKSATCDQPALQSLSTNGLWNGFSSWTAIRQTAARWLSTARKFSVDLKASDPLCYHMGWIMQALVPLFLCMTLVGATQGASPWIKPAKFATSFSTFLWTFAPLLMALRIPEWQRKAARRAVAISVVMEMAFLSAQAWRSAFVAGPPTLTDTIILNGTSAMISVITTVMLWMTLLYFLNSRAQIADKAMLAAIRYALVIFMIGNAVGGYMLARGSHTVGASDGGPGLPFTNWSTIAGDLRIAHFIAIHAIQILPLLAFALRDVMPSARLVRRRMLVYAASTMLLLAVLGTFVQAATGHPLIALGHTQQVARK